MGSELSNIALSVASSGAVLPVRWMAALDVIW